MKLSQEFVASQFIPPPVTENPQEIALKKELFAELLLRDPQNPFRVALAIYPDDTPRALKIATEWPRDIEVVTLQKAMVDEAGEMAFVVTKAQLAQLAMKLATQEVMDPQDRASRVKAAELAAKIVGAIEKPVAATINNTNVLVNRVMVVKDYGNDEQWEQKGMASQANLKRLVLDVAT